MAMTTFPSGTSEGRDLKRLDPVWDRIRDEARALAANEPLMATIAHAVVLHHKSLESAIAFRIAQKLSSPALSEMMLREIADEAFQSDPEIGRAARADIAAVYERDPFCTRLMEPLLYFKGFLGLQSYRVAHWLWTQGRRDLAMFIQMGTSQMFSMDINPAARIGRGIMIDHAHSIVIGETAVVGDDVSMLHSVTLGGTGKDEGDRHPKVGNGVLIGAGAKILGNIRIGDNSRIAAGSVVLKPVPDCVTVAGVPAKIVGDAGCAHPSHSMIQSVPEAPEDIVPDC